MMPGETGALNETMLYRFLSQPEAGACLSAFGLGEALSPEDA